MNKIHKDILDSILYSYNSYKAKEISGRWVQYNQLKDYLQNFPDNKQINIKKLGESYEGRDIDLIKIGTGKIKVFFWSQMHGDESTSTRAILDLLNFLCTEDDNQHIREEILNKITLFIIPLLNPDGAEKFDRRNAQLIDINRDAVSQISPEANILSQTKNELDPDFGFNLHDQSSGYCAGRNYKSSTISLLAPPVDYEGTMTQEFETAMKLIVSIKNDLDEFIPGHVARYEDEFEPRAFGDNFTKQKMCTVLIEAGGWHKDPQREYVRKIYFVTLIKSLLAISDQSFINEDVKEYYQIPENKESLSEIVLRNLTIKNDQSSYKIDLAIKHEVLIDLEEQLVLTKGIISDIGDLSTFYGYEETDMTDYQLIPAKYFEPNKNEKFDIKNLLQQGVGFVKIKSNIKKPWTNHPINYYNNSKPTNNLVIDSYANFFLAKNDQIEFAVINGFLIDLTQKFEFNGNGIIFD